MPLRTWLPRSTAQPGAPGLFALAVTRENWRPLMRDLAAAGSRLVALWASHDESSTAVLRAAFLTERQGLIVTLPLSSASEPYPGIEDLFPAASRMQRATADVSGLRSTDPDRRPWLRHAAWPAGYVPLAPPGQLATANPAVDSYDFVRVEGDGVHEIPVGPVHAGIIEPGHFRFSIVGEKVLRLEERLGYVHKGIERRFTELPIL